MLGFLRKSLFSDGINDEMAFVEDITQEGLEFLTAADDEDDEDSSRMERIHGTGHITVFDKSMMRGVIDRQYPFDISKFCCGDNSQGFQRGSKVDFEAERSLDNPQWRVSSLTLCESEMVERRRRQQQMRLRKLVAQVKSANKEFVQVETGKGVCETFKLPNVKEMRAVHWMRGDWMELLFENIESEDLPVAADGGEDGGALARSKLLSVKPLQKRTVIGRVTRRLEGERATHLLIDESIILKQGVGNSSMLSVGDLVRCTVIQSTQAVGSSDFVSWRAVKAQKTELRFNEDEDNEDDYYMEVAKAGAPPRFRKQRQEEILVDILTNKERRLIRGCGGIRAPFFSQKRLPGYPVPSQMWMILKDKDETELLQQYPNALEVLQFTNYREKFMVSLWFEEMENELRRRQDDLQNVVLTKAGSEYKFAVPGNQDFLPPVNLQDSVTVFDAESELDSKYQGTIIRIFGSEVTCVFGEAFNARYTGFPVTVQFSLSRTGFRRCHFAIETAVEYLGEEILFPTKVKAAAPRILVHEDDDYKPMNEMNEENPSTTPLREEKLRISYFPNRNGPKNSERKSFLPSSTSSVCGRRLKSASNKFVSDTLECPSMSYAKLVWINSRLNEEQKNAVKHILQGEARPLPYIIYGPPGTGKTVTVIEAVMQLNHLDKNSRILVCAPSNAAADIITTYLANSGRYHPGDFVRLNGFLRSSETLSEAIEPYSTNGEDLTNVAMHRLIISTCVTSGQFFSLDLSVGHFTHVFIDEAGYCTEPETMIPAVLLALSKGGQLILAGDPHQLGPVLMGEVARNCGLGMSFLERLMRRQPYARHTEHFPMEHYNPLLVTKLVKNYRSHSTLLCLPSRLFYDNDLQPCASVEEVLSLVQNESLRSKILVTEGVPLVFHGVQGICTRDRDSPSWYNTAEAAQVARYVVLLCRECGLSAEDIGIITPYRKQVEKIRFALRLLEDTLPIKVASVEEFQGGERNVIIISTVRSSVDPDKKKNLQVKSSSRRLERLGFINERKRFNVAITRAKTLMIIVGDPHVLRKSGCWSELLTYAIDLNAYTGCELPSKLNEERNVRLKTEEPF